MGQIDLPYARTKYTGIPQERVNLSTSSITMNNKTVLSILLILTVVGSYFRISGADWGFPIFGHPDEETISIYAYHCAAKGDWNPRTYLRPNHFSVYANALLYKAINAIHFDSPIEKNYHENKQLFYYSSRVLSGFLGTLLIPLSFLILREINPAAALLGAAIVTIYPSFTKHSHFITPDIALTLFSGTCLLFAVKYAKRGNLIYLFAAILFSALAFAEKYPGAVCVLSIAAAIIARPGLPTKRKIGYLAASSIAFFASLFMVAPYLFLRFDLVLAALANESRSGHSGADGLGPIGNAIFYIDQFTLNAGILLLVFAFLGAYETKRQIGPAALPLLLPLFYFILFSAIPLHWERWGVPIYFCLILFSATGAHLLFERFSNFRILKGSLVALIAISMLNQLIETLALNREFHEKDSRVASLSFCQDSGINKENSFCENYGPFFPKGGVSGATFTNGTLSTISTNPAIDYIIISSHMYDRFFAEPKRYQAIIQAHQELQKLPLISSFHSAGYTNPKRKNRSRLSLLNLIKNGPSAIRFITGSQSLYGGPTIMIFDASPLNRSS